MEQQGCALWNLLRKSAACRDALLLLSRTMIVFITSLTESFIWMMEELIESKRLLH
jgi:hypothetical protein